MLLLLLIVLTKSKTKNKYQKRINSNLTNLIIIRTRSANDVMLKNRNIHKRYMKIVLRRRGNVRVIFD